MGRASRYAREMRLLALLAFALAVAAACSEFGGGDDPAPGGTADGGADAGNNAPSDDAGPGNDSSTTKDASCDAVAVDYDFSSYPLGPVSFADGGTVNVTDGSLVTTTANGGYAYLYARFELEPASASFGFTFDVDKPDTYIQAGCQLVFDDGISLSTNLLVGVDQIAVYFDDALTSGATTTGGANPVVLFSWQVATASGPHRIDLDIPAIGSGAVGVTVTLDGKQLPTTYQTSLAFEPTAVSFLCGSVYEDPITPSTKKIVIDDVHLRACPR
jgi:hypothetical protein